MASQQKTWEELDKANLVLIEGTQVVIRREVEIMQKAMQEFAGASRDLIETGDAQVQARLELAKTSFEAALRNMHDLAELAGRSNREMLEKINQWRSAVPSTKTSS